MKTEINWLSTSDSLPPTDNGDCEKLYVFRTPNEAFDYHFGRLITFHGELFWIEAHSKSIAYTLKEVSHYAEFTIDFK